MDKDKWIEILQILVRKPLRTLLACTGIGWGILMLIVFVGASKGLENGVKNQTRNISMNSMFMWTMRTSIPFGGFQQGRRFELDNSDVAFLEETFDEIEAVAPRNQLGGYRGGNNVSHGAKTGAFNVYGDSPDYIRISPVKITSGRYLNEQDIIERRKICVIGEEVVKLLFGKEEPIGSYITVNGINFLVVGTFSPYSSGEDNESATSSIFVPYTTFQRVFNYGDKIGWLSILGKPEFKIQELEGKIETALKQRKNVHPDDRRAFGKNNFGEQAEKMKVMNESIEKIGYIIGGFVLFAGLVGVINIMLVTVKERTKEFGIRRALGATPRSIIYQVVLETLLLTVLSALAGAALGILLLNLIASFTGDAGSGAVFVNPSIPLRTVLIALTITIIFGALAGLMPALRAVAIKPVDALKANG